MEAREEILSLKKFILNQKFQHDQEKRELISEHNEKLAEIGGKLDGLKHNIKTSMHNLVTTAKVDKQILKLKIAKLKKQNETYEEKLEKLREHLIEQSSSNKAILAEITCKPTELK